jgi:hypothetical protein
MTKLNLGCGHNKKQDYINVDCEGDPDVKWDLERFPWPWKDSTVTQILMVHVLEHLGQDPETYKRIWQELYRVCTPSATLTVKVPHWRHDNFWSDPTHVRTVTPMGLALLSKNFNETCEKAQASNSPLGLYWGVDFEIEKVTLTPSKTWHLMHQGDEGEANYETLVRESEIYCNLVEEVEVMLRAVKCWPSTRT